MAVDSSNNDYADRKLPDRNVYAIFVLLQLESTTIVFQTRFIHDARRTVSPCSSYGVTLGYAKS